MKKSKRVLSPAQLEHCHKFTIIGRTVSLAANIESLLIDKSIPDGLYREFLREAYENLEAASKLVRAIQLKREYL